MRHIKSIMRFLLPFLGNFYFSTGIFLLVWMLFFDANNLIQQYKLTKKYTTMLAEKRFYQQKIAEVQQEKREVFGSAKQVEKYAREKYLMKKPTEDLYLLK